MVVRSLTASFGPGPCSRPLAILNVDQLRLRFPEWLRPWPEPKPVVCERNPSLFASRFTVMRTIS